MNYEEIASKELEGQDVAELTKDFDDSNKADYLKTFNGLALKKKEEALLELQKTKKEKEDELIAIRGIREGKSKIQTELDKEKDGLKQQVRDEELRDILEKQRLDQVEKAKAKFYKDFDISDESKSSLEEAFKSEDSKKTDSDLIYEDFKRAYVKSNPDKFIEAVKKQKEFEQAAADFTAEQTSFNGGQGGGASDKQYSQEVLDTVKAAKASGIPMTLEEAEKGLSRMKN